MEIPTLYGPVNFGSLTIFLNRVLSEPDLNIRLDGFHASLKAQSLAVQAQIIVSGVVPLLSGVVVVVLCPILVRALDKFFHVFSRMGAPLDGLLQAVLR